MQHYRSLEEVNLQNSWLTIGVFDGVHRGHQEILKKLTAGAHANGAPAVVLTFDPHPASVLGGQEIKCLTLPDERAELLGKLGVDVVITEHFTRESSDLLKRNEGEKLPSMNEPVEIVLENVSFRYEGSNQLILDDINLKISKGEKLAIVGANGAGKSTLLMLLMGILFPQQAEVLIGDTHLTKKTLTMIRQRMGMVMQNPDDQLFMTTVYDDVAFGPRNYRLDEKEVEKRVLDALDIVGISHLGRRAPFKLSGGEKRAASIATTLSMLPDILIMVEPTAGLDPKSRRRVMELLLTIRMIINR
jgi:cobalt/nickel transport system ATP-binding protein